MSVERAADSLYNLFETCRTSFSFAISDSEESGAHTAYSLDFSAVYPAIYKPPIRRPTASKDQYDYQAQSVFELLPAVGDASNTQLVMNDFGIIEFFDQLDHHHRSFDRLAEVKATSQQYFKILSGSADDQRLTSSDVISRLEPLVNSNMGAPTTKKIAAFCDHFRKGRIKTIRDIYSESDLRRVQHADDTFQDYLKVVDDYRTKKDVGDPADIELHRLIDAWTITLTKELHSLSPDRNFLFIGPTRLRSIFGDDRHEYTRNLRTLHARFKSLGMSRGAQSQLRAANSILRSQISNARAVIEILENWPQLDKLPAHLMDTIAIYRKNLLQFTYGENSMLDNANQKREEILRFIKSPDDIRDLSKREAAAVAEQAGLLAEVSGESLDDETLEGFRLRDLTRVNQILTNLHLD